MSVGYRQLIAGNRNFRNLLFGQYISELGTWFNFVAGISLVREVSGGAPEVAGLLLFWRTLPFALLTPVAGAFADRYSRRTVMLATDVVRVAFALLFLLVARNEDLWIAYFGSVLLSIATAFFDAAKNAAIPNISGKEGLLSATALMFSSRFILMSFGALLGGIAAATIGYRWAFVINSASFAISAVFVWLIPAEAMFERSPEKRRDDLARKGLSSLAGTVAAIGREISEGVRYTFGNRFALTVLLINIIWAIGGGASNIVFEALGVSVFRDRGYTADYFYSFLMAANGLGLAIGVLGAKRLAAVVERRNLVNGFMGWALILHGVLFALAGFMPFAWLVALFVLLSRALIGAQYTVQETLFQRMLPDEIRGRISTFDRGAEITVYSISSLASGLALTSLSAPTVFAASGLLAGMSGVVWFLRIRKGTGIEGMDKRL
ncbi:MAG: MFS transporter [Pyrinomonadaceae bacterium]